MFSRKLLVASRKPFTIHRSLFTKAAVLALLLVSGNAEAGVLDFRTLSDAKTAYEKGDYVRASQLYGEVRSKNPQAMYNLGDSLYKQKKYKEAAEIFKQIDDPGLKHKALHNLGNSLANMGKTDEAIKAYEEALKLKEDKDTRYNLELLKKQKKQQQKKKNKKNDKKKNDQKKKDQKNKDQQKKNQKQDQKNKDRKNKDGSDKKQQDQKRQDKQNRQNKNKDQKKNDQQKQKRQNRSEQQKQKDKEKKQREKQKSEAQKKKEQQERKKRQQQAQAAKAQPISDMEERKYNKMLNKRGIKTLMIPLQSKGKPHENETTPW